MTGTQTFEQFTTQGNGLVFNADSTDELRRYEFFRQYSSDSYSVNITSVTLNSKVFKIVSAVPDARLNVTGSRVGSFLVNGIPTAFNYTASVNTLMIGAISANVTVLTVPLPDAVTDLTSTSVTQTSVTLDWTEPNLHGGTLSGYMINYTTPYGTPSTILVANTGSSTSSYVIGGLSVYTPYSFRVSAWTQAGTNATGNIYNISTLNYPNATGTVSSDLRAYDAGGTIECSSRNGAAIQDISEGAKVNVANGCIVPSLEWDLTTFGIPSTATVLNATIEYDITALLNWNQDCQLRAFSTRPSTSSAGTFYHEGWHGTIVADHNADCQSTGNNYLFVLNAAGIADLQNNFSGGEGWWAVSMQSNTTTVDGTSRLFDIRPNDARLTITYTILPPDAVDTLTYTNIGETFIDLSWTTPDLNHGTLSGYMINYTTPHDNPLTVLVNDSHSSSTAYTVNGLTRNTPYSFRVSAWTNEGNNATGNILNITTTFSALNFTIGSINFNSTNPDIIPIMFERTDINDTATQIDVIYPDSFDLGCDLEYAFANSNRTYTNLTRTSWDTGRVASSFLFTGSDNEIITMHCYDQNSDEDGRYVIQQSSFPLLDQLNNFRNGTFGTMGMFGAIDLITLAVVIVSMIGFNRVNEAVGAVLNIAMLGALAYFQIIELPTIILGGFAVAIVLAVAATRKD